MSGLMDRIFAVVGAFTFSQWPLFMQHYQNHLTGHASELLIQIEAMRRAASLSGKSLQEYVLKFLSSSDLDFKNQGELMQQMIDRQRHLTEALESLQQAPLYFKPFFFIKYYDKNIGYSTWESYQTGFLFNGEGAIYSLIGIIFGLCLYWMIQKLFKFTIFSAFKKKQISKS